VNAHSTVEGSGGEVDVELKIEVALAGLVVVTPGMRIKAGHG